MGAWGFILSLNHDWYICQRQRVEFLRKGSHKGPLFRMFPLSLQSIISNQMRPRRLRGAWFSRLLRHPVRRRSGSILSPGTHTESSYSYFLVTGFPAPISHLGMTSICCKGWVVLAFLATHCTPTAGCLHSHRVSYCILYYFCTEFHLDLSV